MPYRIQCPYCARIGLVRLEQVITGSMARQLYYCGYCEHEWDGQSPANPGKTSVKPKADRRKRPRRSVR